MSLLGDTKCEMCSGQISGHAPRVSQARCEFRQATCTLVHKLRPGRYKTSIASSPATSTASSGPFGRLASAEETACLEDPAPVSSRAALAGTSTLGNVVARRSSPPTTSGEFTPMETKLAPRSPSPASPAQAAPSRSQRSWPPLSCGPDDRAGTDDVLGARSPGVWPMAWKCGGRRAPSLRGAHHAAYARSAKLDGDAV